MVDLAMFKSNTSSIILFLIIAWVMLSGGGDCDCGDEGDTIAGDTTTGYTASELESALSSLSSTVADTTTTGLDGSSVYVYNSSTSTASTVVNSSSTVTTTTIPSIAVSDISDITVDEDDSSSATGPTGLTANTS